MKPPRRTARRPGKQFWTHAAAATPIIALVMTFSVLSTFTDFPAFYVLHARGAQRHSLDGDALVPSAASPGRARRRRRADADGAVSAGGDLFSSSGLQRRAWQQGWQRQMSDKADAGNGVPAIPAATLGDALRPDRCSVRDCFPFYWMLMTVKSNEELYVKAAEPLLGSSSRRSSFREAAVPAPSTRNGFGIDPHLVFRRSSRCSRQLLAAYAIGAAAVQGLAPGRAWSIFFA